MNTHTLSSDEVRNLRALYGGMARHVVAPDEEFAARVAEARNRAMRVGREPKGVLIGRQEDRVLREMCVRHCTARVEPGAVERREFMGMKVYVVDAETFLEVMP